MAGPNERRVGQGAAHGQPEEAAGDEGVRAEELRHLRKPEAGLVAPEPPPPVADGARAGALRGGPAECSRNPQRHSTDLERPQSLGSLNALALYQILRLHTLELQPRNSIAPFENLTSWLMCASIM